MSLALSVALERPGFRLTVDQTLPADGVTAVFGPSGCGKTTLLRCIAGLERPRGRIVLDGHVVHDDADGIWVPVEARRVGLVFQDARLFAHLSVAGNLRYAARRSGATAAERDELLELLGIGALLRRAPAELSGGERQRVAIARTLLARPRVLLLDEPLSAVDEGHRREILPWLERAVAELRLPTLLVTHNLDEVVRLAGHLLLMDGGRVTAGGRLTEMLARPDLPLARREDAGAVLEARGVGYDARHHMSELRCGSTPVWLAGEHVPEGRAVRVRIHASDVTLALESPGATSALNRFQGVVETVTAEPAEGRCLVAVATDGGRLLASLSSLSRERLGIEPGRRVWAMAKTVALV
ncbi:molybdenum ABC transporter ATP-binding protein [Arhodomonas aquaeolei]|uniref:molybdenum ABC transporter ATP-binding protein n=1 Tax=Arhodomonas aquaeolei TaxID=2369 RepID=UPI00036879A3|nr:molybdenum ABC transporter ATP-binding protein [Arhodomonas aquaeolei]